MNATYDGVDDGLGEEEMDPEVVQIIAYLAGSLSPEDAEQFEERLVEDAALFNKAAPFMKLWEYERGRVARMGGATPALVVSDGGSTGGGAGAAGGVAKESTLVRRTRWTTGRIMMAAGFLLAALGVSALVQSGVITKDRMAIVWQAITLTRKPLPERIPKIETHEGPKVEPKVESPTAAVPTAERKGDSTKGAAAATAAVTVTPPIPEERFTLAGDDVTVALRPGAKLNRLDSPALAATGQRDVAVWLTAGEAVFEVLAHFIDVRTDAGRVMLGPGRFALRCSDPCTELKVSVGRGLAILRPDGRPSLPLIGSGSFGRMTKDGGEKTDGAGYPEVPVPASTTKPDTTATRDTTGTGGGGPWYH